MKRVLLAFIMALSVAPLSAQQTWPVSAEAHECMLIRDGIRQIHCSFAATGGAPSSPSLYSAIYWYLRRINTPAAYKVYLELKASGELKNY